MMRLAVAEGLRDWSTSVAGVIQPCKNSAIRPGAQRRGLPAGVGAHGADPKLFGALRSSHLLNNVGRESVHVLVREANIESGSQLIVLFGYHLADLMRGGYEV